MFFFWKIPITCENDQNFVSTGDNFIGFNLFLWSSRQLLK